ncbi:hypothetical protein FRC12_003163 [Ceratobasidium sp. 428]|nr:hypothetical protein FRC12_003163 [Ceratobasidium sp. 428]
MSKPRKPASSRAAPSIASNIPISMTYYHSSHSEQGYELPLHDDVRAAIAFGPGGYCIPLELLRSHLPPKDHFFFQGAITKRGATACALRPAKRTSTTPTIVLAVYRDGAWHWTDLPDLMATFKDSFPCMRFIPENKLNSVPSIRSNDPRSSASVHSIHTPASSLVHLPDDSIDEEGFQVDGRGSNNGDPESGGESETDSSEDSSDGDEVMAELPIGMDRKASSLSHQTCFVIDSLKNSRPPPTVSQLEKERFFDQLAVLSCSQAEYQVLTNAVQEYHLTNVPALPYEDLQAWYSLGIRWLAALDSVKGGIRDRHWRGMDSFMDYLNWR